MTRYWLTLLLSLSLSAILDAQSNTNACIKSTEGKDFWFGFMESRHHQSGHYLELTMASTYTCHFNLYVGKSTTPFISGTLTPNSPFRFQPYWPTIEPIGS